MSYFNQIFVGLCKLFADVDVDVKNGSNLLDRLIKVRANVAVSTYIHTYLRRGLVWRAVPYHVPPCRVCGHVARFV